MFGLTLKSAFGNKFNGWNELLNNKLLFAGVSQSQYTIDIM